MKELPDLSELDNGYRLRDTTIVRCYGISLEMIKEFMKAAGCGDMLGCAVSYADDSSEDSLKPDMFRFIFKQAENEAEIAEKRAELVEKLDKAIPEIANSMRTHIISTRDHIMYGCRENKNGKENKKIKEIFFNILRTVDLIVTDGKKTFVLPEEDIKELTDKLNKNIIQSEKTEHSAKSKNRAQTLVDKNKVKTTKFAGLITAVASNESLFDDQGKKGLSLVNMLPSAEFFLLMAQDDPLGGVREVVARMRSITLMMFDEYAKAPKKGSFRYWCAAEYLCISDELLKEEKKFKQP